MCFVPFYTHKQCLGSLKTEILKKHPGWTYSETRLDGQKLSFLDMTTQTPMFASWSYQCVYVCVIIGEHARILPVCVI